MIAFISRPRNHRWCLRRSMATVASQRPSSGLFAGLPFFLSLFLSLFSLFYRKWCGAAVATIALWGPLQPFDGHQWRLHHLHLPSLLFPSLSLLSSSLVCPFISWLVHASPVWYRPYRLMPLTNRNRVKYQFWKHW